MDYYNGYTPSERSRKLSRLHNWFPNRSHPYYSGACHMCGDPSSPVAPHGEDYSEPYLWERPAVYACAAPVTAGSTSDSSRPTHGRPISGICGVAATVLTSRPRRWHAMYPSSPRHWRQGPTSSCQHFEQLHHLTHGGSRSQSIQKH
jgi:hypothetical protein